MSEDSMSEWGGSPRVKILLPPPMQGSGGHRTAVSAGESLASAGFDVCLHFQPQGPASSEPEVQEQASAWHGARLSSVRMGWPSAFADSDAVIATTWQSAAYLAGCETRGRKMHFVQDYEAWFHPTGDQSVAALGVHHLGLATIVIGNWLQAMLWTKHQLPTWSIPFTADAGLYRPHGPLSARPPTVVGMFQPEKYRRCAGLMRAALQAVLAGREDVQVITVGSAQSPDLGPRHRHLGLVSKDELPTIYRASAVGFSLSSTNPSRVPFEMMASGLPVVEFGGENTVFDLPGDACVLANPDPASMASAILTLVNDESRRTTLAESGVAFMKDRESAREGEAFVAAVRSALAGEHPVGQMPIPVYRKEIVAFEPRVPWSGDHAHAELGEARNDPLAKQLEVNGALNEVNVELNRVNQELNAANHVLSHDNDVISAENAALSAENARLAETLASERLRYNRTLEGKIRRRIGREP